MAEPEMMPRAIDIPTWVRWVWAGSTLLLFTFAVACIGFGIFGWALPPARPLASFIGTLGLFTLGMAGICSWSLARRRTARGRAVGFGLVLFAALSLLSLALVEAGLTFLRPAMTLSRAVELSPRIFRQSSFLPFQLEPGYQAETPSREAAGDVLVTVNSHGFRGPEFAWKKPPGTYRVLVLGDSFALNRGVNDWDVHTAVLQQRLNRLGTGRRRFEVINAGYADGYSPDAYLAFMQHEGFSLDPDFVIMQYFVLNDFNDLLETEVVERRDGMPFRVRSRYRHVDRDGRFRNNVSLKYKLPILRNSHLYVALYKLLDAENALIALAPRILPDYSGVNFSPNDHGIRQRDVYLDASDRPPILQEKFHESLGYVRLLGGACREAGIDFSLFLVPTGIQVARGFWPGELADDWDDPNPQKQIREALAGSGVRILDPLETFREALPTGPLYFGAKQNGHWTAAGNRVAAAAMEAHLMTIPAIGAWAGVHELVPEARDSQ